MMTHETRPLASIDKIIKETSELLQMIEDVPQMTDTRFNTYRKICHQMPGHIRSGRLKIAVAGVIKSGKSTLVNSLVGKELVKRGAGVVTSITTRLQKGRKNKARLYFKSWDDINLQIQKAVLLFPDDGSDSDIGNTFDIRRKKDRTYLKEVYQSLITDFPVTKEGIRPETLLIGHALQGFDVCKDLVQADETVMGFESKEVEKHKVYTSDPNIAFYIKDVCIDVFGKAIGPNIEIADCQGADSTDPGQLNQVLTYLESSNLILYCISSRTGIRQADITFLKRIKNLGRLENILFVNNCDLTEHENLEDLIKIETSIRNNLEFLDIRPRVFSFSSLYNLFAGRGSKLSKKELSRLKLWQEEKEMIHYCDQKTREFNSFFKQVLDKNRYDLLLSNHLKRLDIIVGQLDQQTTLFLELLSSDKSKEETAVKAFDNLCQNAARLEVIVSNSMEAAVGGLKDEILASLKDIFIRDSKAILKDAQTHIRTLSIDVEKYRSVSKETGFNQILYLMFQEFNRNLAVYGIETVQPRLKTIVECLEKRVSSYFQSLFDSYQIDVLKADAYSQFEVVSKLSLQQNKRIDVLGDDNIKKILGLQLPAVIFEAKYTPRIKASVFTEFGLQTVSQIFFSLFKKSPRVSFVPGLKRAAAKIKKENQKVIKDQFEDYHRAVKTNYFLPLIEAATRDFKEKINERFIGYHAVKKEVELFFSLKHREKKDQKKKIQAIQQKIKKVAANIASFPKISWE